MSDLACRLPFVKILGGSLRSALATVARGPVGVAAAVAPPTDLASPFTATESQMGSVAVWQELLGVDATDLLPLTRAEAMTVPSMARARNVLTGAVARLPIVHKRGGERWVGPSPVTQPERGRARFSTLAWTVDAQVFYGRAWWIVTDRYAETGRPAYFEWVPEWRGIFATTGELIGHTDGRRFAAEDVVRIDGPHEGVLNFGSRTLRGALRLDRAAYRVADNPVPAIELHQTEGENLTAPERDEMLASWRAARRGEGGAVGYTPRNLETKIHGVNPEQLLIEGRKQAALEVARMVGVPAWVVDVGIEGSSLTYTNVASRSRELVDYGALPYMLSIAGRLSLDDILPRGQWCEFDTTELLAADFGDRMTAYKAAIESKVYTVEELRAREHGTPAEETA